MQKRFEAVSLSFNVGIPGSGALGDMADCNPGGSVICDPGTGGCGAGGMSCVGNSCGGSSATRDLAFDSRIFVDREKLSLLKKELTGLVKKYGR